MAALSARFVRFTVLVVVLFSVGLPAIASVPSGAPVDGVRCEAMEGTAFHIHAHLAIYDHGKPVLVPEDVGRPLAAQCIYWLHTHTPDGIIHIESPVFQTFTIGQFMDVWGVPMTAADVAGARPRKGESIRVFVDGRPYRGDPRKIELAQHLDVDVLVGPPYTMPRAFTAWNGN